MHANVLRLERLTRHALAQAVHYLVQRDRGLASIVATHGSPPLWSRRPGFATLARIVLEQQVSLASAIVVYRRVGRELPAGWTPTSVLAVGEAGLRARGITRQKARYIAELANRIERRQLRLSTLARAPDSTARAQLLALPGIGPWTASIYLLMALGRPDVWPPGDLALHNALAKLRGLAQIPSSDEAARLATQWAPYRAVAARILWHGYLSTRAVEVRRRQAGLPLK
jgi:DNA-3-methyladenine glycosylase II